MNKGDKASAADAINVVRARAKAPLCTAADVTIDYILDERARETYGEMNRWEELGAYGNVVRACERV